MKRTWHFGDVSLTHQFQHMQWQGGEGRREEKKMIASIIPIWGLIQQSFKSENTLPYKALIQYSRAELKRRCI